ncbi:hypothetical protein P7K49_012212 [Saguinus oedipus]|uniref:Uncharacterized protein n=1 Tax=Saguinus oedipus TaxID=9490 RepID=A0ABQ9VTF6_SAGOE|nr:hypothetical protein P7K49_012212 [Saguinus oedipus]
MEQGRGRDESWEEATSLDTRAACGGLGPRPQTGPTPAQTRHPWERVRGADGRTRECKHPASLPARPRPAIGCGRRVPASCWFWLHPYPVSGPPLAAATASSPKGRVGVSTEALTRVRWTDNLTNESAHPP